MEENKKHNRQCLRCRVNFVYFNEECKWDYQGYTPTKLAQCPNCGCWQPVKYEAEQNVNFDPRYYE